MTALSLALRNLTLRRWRTAMLLIGYGLGVATMIVLLSIGEALVLQASDEKLVGGGDLTVLPEGIDVEVMKTGGLGGMFFSIDHSRFIYRQLLTSTRRAGQVVAAAPQISGKLLYLGTHERELAVIAQGEVPSRTEAVGAAAPLVAGTWRDDDVDRRWISPTPAELRSEIDHFHLPPASARGDSSWGEWHYFNVLWPGGKKWAFISFLVGGSVPDGQWGGQVLVTIHEIGRPARRYEERALPRAISFSTHSPDLAVGGSGVTLLPDGRYRIRARAVGERSEIVNLDLVVGPAPHAYFPGAAIGGDAIVSGYVVPGLRATASGRICAPGCEDLENVQSYHDHNWGVWRDVGWEWGAARAGNYSLLYGRLVSDSIREQPLFVYVVDSLGFVGLFRPRAIRYVDGRTARVGGVDVRVPSAASMRDARGEDFLQVDLTVDDATATDIRGGARSRPRPGRRYFIQMKGVARITGRIGGRDISGVGDGFFETYR